MKSKKAVIVFTMLAMASLFLIGADWAGSQMDRLFHSYFADITIPFGLYLLLILVEGSVRLLEKWYIKAIAVFLLCSLSETLQYFGIYALATVFDPLDYMMYALGVLSGAFFDRILFKQFFSFWKG